MNRRLEVFKYSVKERKLGGSLKSWVLNCLGPTCDVLAKRCIEELEETDEFMRIKLKRHDDSLFFPKSISLRSLYQSIAEQSYEWQWHYYQIPQTRIDHNDIVFDCGSAEGIFCYLNYKRAKFMYAFEPLPEYVAGLTRTFKDIPNVRIVNSALGDVCGHAYLNKCGIESFVTSEETETRINIDTIDHFCEASDVNVSYIKADLEGYEMNLLKVHFRQ